MPNKPDPPKLNDQQKAEVNRLLDKSQEAFILAIELFNRPTIRYRIEGCAFFLCNAWELMLKAYLIKRDGYDSIFCRRKGSSQKYSIPLTKCVAKVMTNKHDPVRENLETIIRLRNKGAHFIVPEYEITYGPIFQSNIYNFDHAMYRYTGINVSKNFPDNFLTLNVNPTAMDQKTIRTKYTPEVAEALLRAESDIQNKEKEQQNNPNFSLGKFQLDLTLSKKDGIPIHYDKSSNTGVSVIKKYVDTQQQYPFTPRHAIEEISGRLKGTQIRNGDKYSEFNSWHLKLFVDCYGMKHDKKFGHVEKRSEKTTYTSYSQYAVDFITLEVEKDPNHIVEKLKRGIRENVDKNKGQPQEQRNSKA